jgi:hypothetical protein
VAPWFDDYDQVRSICDKDMLVAVPDRCPVGGLGRILVPPSAWRAGTEADPHHERRSAVRGPNLGMPSEGEEAQ